MKHKILLFLVVLVVFYSCKNDSKKIITNDIIGEINMEDKTFIEKQISLMDEIIIMHDKIKDIHISLKKLYPITVVNDGFFFIFDINEMGNKYEFKGKHVTPMPISGNILAAFSLDFYEMKPSAVISNNILENRANDVLIFHEFVHCYQIENGEFEIRKELKIEKQEMAKNNYSWELNFPFPYSNNYFVDKTTKLAEYFTNEDYGNVLKYFHEMKTHLQEIEFEYMIWQNWKEGFARYIENMIRNKLGQQLNSNEIKHPFDRVHFYEIGRRYIEMLIMNNEVLENNIVELFNVMK